MRAFCLELEQPDELTKNVIVDAYPRLRAANFEVIARKTRRSKLKQELFRLILNRIGF